MHDDQLPAQVLGKLCDTSEHHCGRVRHDPGHERTSLPLHTSVFTRYRPAGVFYSLPSQPARRASADIRLGLSWAACVPHYHR